MCDNSYQVNLESEKLKSTSCCLGDPLEVDLFAPAHSHSSRLHEVLEAQIIDAPRGQDNVGSSC